MISPRLATLETLGIDRAQARMIKRIAKAADSEETLRAVIDAHCPDTAAYVRSMFSDPYRSHMWRVTVALHAIDRILGTHGVEALSSDSDSMQPPPYEYCNAGDTYAATLIYKRATDRLFLGCWGDIVERDPAFRSAD